MKNKRFAGMLLIMLMMVGILAGTLTVASAASTVTVNSWSGLQSAINKASSEQTIQLSADITCTKDGGDRIKIDGKKITIDLNGHKLDRNRTESDGDGHVIELVGSAYVTLKDSKGGGTITGGYATRGGGINIGSGAWLVFQGGTITGNKAEWGGGIYVHGTLAMQGGTIKKNHATDSGGGIHVGSGGTIRGCNSGTITENTADNGAGIYNSGSTTVWLRRLKITDNTATDDGGGIENADKGKLSLFACTITGNKASDEGGGVFNGDSCELSVDSCSINSNTANDEGGGIFNKGPLTVTGSEIRENKTTGNHGGGVRMWSNEATFTNTKINDNTAKNRGGGIYIGEATVTVDGGEISGNIAQDDDGGAILNTGTLTVKNGTVIDGNTGKDGGGVFNFGGTATLNGVTISNNTSKDDGGGFENGDKGKATLTACTITGNKTADEGGGVFNGDDCKLTIERCTISDNTATDEGGAIFNKGPLTVTGGVISGNTATNGHGGGIRLWSNTATFTRVEISGNKSENGDGGGFYIGDATLTLTGGLYTNNTARVDGGAIYSKGNLTIKGNAVFKKNSATNSGGAIRVDGKTATIEDGTFSENWAGDHGGGIYVSASTLKLYGGSITNNTAWKRGGGMLVSSSGSIKVHGAPVIKDNKASTRGDDLYLGGSTKLELDAKLTSGAFFGVDSEKVFYTVRGASDDLRKEINDAKADEIDYAFTKNFYTYNLNSDFTRFFKTHDHFTLRRKGNEVAIRPSNWSKLQALVDAAENGDTIVLDRDYFSVKLEAALNIDGKKTLTIDLNGHKLDRGLTKPAASGAVIMNQGTLIIKDSKGGGRITGGYADDHAGGIWNPGTLTIEGGAITGNQCVNCGGGIHNSGTLTVTGGAISNNIADGDGGGVYSQGTLTVSGGEFSGNTAGLSGGALNIAGKTATITGGVYTGNKAERYHGGGIYLSNATLNLQGGSITGNTAAMEGGGILYGSNAKLNVQGAPVVDGNSASSGANLVLRKDVLYITGQLTEEARLDLVAFDLSKPLTSGLTASGSSMDSLTYNQASGAAPTLKNGELFMDVNVTADKWVGDWKSLQNAINSAGKGQTIGLIRNLKANGADRIKVDDGKDLTIELNGKTLDRQRTSSSGDGHVIEVKGNSVLNIKDSIGTGGITGGWATRGGGINVAEGSTVYMEGGSIHGNKAKYGGGVYAHGYFEMRGGNINNNTATEWGGGVCVDKNDHSNFSSFRGTISNNTAKYGGGMYDEGSTGFWPTGLNIVNNTATKDGGGIYVAKREIIRVMIISCTISDNRAEGDGGGVYCSEEVEMAFSGCTVENNTCGGQGGGLFTKGRGRIINNYTDRDDPSQYTPLIIRNNTAKGNGGGIYMSKGHPEFVSGVVTGNKSQEGDGGGIYIEDGTLDVVPYDYIEISGNEAQAGNGGGVYIKKGALNMEGGKIIGNEVQSGDGGGVYIDGGALNLDSDNIEITGNKAQAGNGGGVYVKEGELKLYGGKITGNEAKKKAGGIYKEANQTCRVYIHGAPVVNENKAGVSAPNIFIAGDSSLSLDGALTEGAVLGVSLENDLHPITWAYKQHMGRADPEKYFIVEGDERICLNESDFPVICHSDWCDLQKEIDAAEDGATITLQRDWTGGRGAIPLYFNEGKTLTLDLNGHKLDRAARAGESYYVNDGKAIVIRRDSTLTIKDSVGTGVITGAYDGCIKNEGTLYLEGGTITGNYSQGVGAGVNSGNNKDTAYMKMTGGKITGNEAGTNGGGLWSGDKLEILGGEITNNTAHSHGGGLYIGSMATIADGIRITGNITKASGGGIYLSSRGTLNLNGVTVTGNSATSDGGGIMSVGTLNVQGAPVVKDNTGTRGNNIFLPTGKVVNVVGPLSDDARLDLTAQDISNVLTKGLVKNGLQSADDQSYRKLLTYNNNEGPQPEIKNGELFVDFSAKADVYVKDWQGLQDALNNAGDGTVIALSKDISSGDKGRIEVKKGKSVILDLNGYTLTRDMSPQEGAKSDGQVIVVKSKSTLTIKDTRGTGIITGGHGKHGGGIVVEDDCTCILQSGTIRGNSATYGGGVYAHGTFKMTGGSIAFNVSMDSGGGIHCGSDGTLELTGGNVTGNESFEDGGGIYISGSKNVTITNVRIADNHAKGIDKVKMPSPDIDAGIAEISFTHKDPKTVYYGGGGLSSEKGSEVTLKNCVITGNRTESRGGGVYSDHKSTLTMEGCTVEKNTAAGSGAGVCSRGKLIVKGGKYTGNTAGDFGGGICVTDDDNASISISGALEVHDNKGGKGNNLYLSTLKMLHVTGKLTNGAKIGVLLESGKGIFATGFNTKNQDEDPKLYFFSEESYDIVQQGNYTGLTEEFVFVPTNAHPVSYKNVNSRNWMSGIPGDRTLNEINLPGTHDAAMNYPESAVSAFEDPGSMGSGASYAKTQLRYINEQYDDGFRYVDLRLNNKHQVRHNGFYEFFTIDYEDDGKNLWLCHGCDSKGGTYYAKDQNGDYTTFNEVLEWTKKFLREHPSEVIIISIRPETQWPDQWHTIYMRAKKILYNLSLETNPSTGKSYLYMEDGVFGKDYTYYPKLKDVRGQIFLRVNHDRDPNNSANLGGLASWSAGGNYKTASPDGEFEASPGEKISYINAFYQKYGGIELPRDVATHLDVMYDVPTNIVEKEDSIFGMVPVEIPTESAKVVNASLFADGAVFDQKGYYLGWVNMIDAGMPDTAARIWKTNFYDMDYVTLTVDAGVSAADLESGLYAENADSGLSEIEIAAALEDEDKDEDEGEAVEQKPGVYTFRLFKGTEITLPQCLYTYDQTQTGRAFQSWNVTGETENATHLPGETFAVMEDMTISAQWLADGETSVDVRWQDADDADGLRADELELEVWPDEDPEHAYTQTVTAADGWRAVLNGDVKKIVPMWERVDAEAEGGADTEAGYRYEVSDVADETDGEETMLPGSGLVLKMIHTPQNTVMAAGAIEWNDYDDRDGLRPESATLRLMKGEEELGAQTITAEDEWQYDFGELPVYEDGLAVEYSLTEDEIPNYFGVAGEDFSVTNTHTPRVKRLTGGIQWEDADNAGGQRPESVTVRLLANGVEVNTLTVTADGASATLLDVPVEDGRVTDYVEYDGEMADEEEYYEADEAEEATPATEPEPQPEPEPEDEYDDEEDEDEDDEGEAEEAGQTVVNNWTFRFYGVPVNEHGEKVTYTIVMDAVEGYATETVAENGVWFVNVPLPQSVLLTYDANGGTGEMASAEIDPRDEYALPECGFTAPEGMEFAGWAVLMEAPQAEETEGEAEATDPTEEPADEAAEATIYNVGDIITFNANATIIAQWQPIPPVYTIAFDGNGGEGEMEAAQPNEEGEYTLPESAFTAPEGMEFVGWKIAAEGATTEEAAEGEKIAIEDASEPSVDPERTYEPGDTITLTTDVTAIAQWQEPAKPIVITFDANGGEGEMEAAQPDEFGEYVLPENGFTAPEGAEFAGWLVATEAPEADGEAADEAGRVFSAGDAIVVSADTTVVAQWLSNEPEESEPAVVTFDANGGEGEMEPAQPDEEGNYELPECGFTAPEGMEFAGWMVGEMTYQAGGTIAVFESIEAVAQWQEIPVEISVTVTLKVVNGAWTDDTKDDKIIVLTGHEGDELRLNLDDLPGVGYNPDEGYAMGSWDVEPSINMDIEGIEPDAPIAEDTTYTYTYAVKEEVEVPTWSILFDANGGEGEMASATVENMDGYALPECGYTAPEGMEFAGWLFDEYVLDPGEVLVVSSDIQVTAQWKAIEAAPVEGQPTEQQPTEEQPTEEQPTEEQPTEGQPTEGQPTEGQPTEEQPTEQQPTEEQATEEKPAEEKSSDEQPTEEQATEEKPAEEKSSDEQPTEEQLTEGQPTEGQPTEGQPTEGQPTEDQPTEEQPTEEKPAEEKSSDEQPTEGQPTEEQPTEQQPTEEQPTEQQPVDEQPTEQQPTEQQPTEEQPTEQQPVEQQPVEEQPTEQQPTEQQPTEQQPTESEPEEEKAVEAPSAEEQPTEQQPTEEQPVEQQPVEEQPTEQQPVEQQPTEQQPTEQQPTESEPEEEKAVEAPSAEEQPTEQQPVEEQPTEQQPVEQQPTEQQPTEGKPAEQKPAEAPADAQMCTITFDGGGADGEMAPVQVAKGSKYTLPECDFYIDGCTFSVWTVYADGVETAACFAGDAITVNGDITVMAGWTFDEGGEIEYGADNTEYVEGGTSDSAGNGLEVETEDSGLDVEYEEVETELSAEPSEVGSVFNGAGLAAIIAAVVLVLGGAAIAILKKKRK